MVTIFESDHNWTGNPSPESVRFSYTFHPQHGFMSFYDYAIDIMSSFELVQSLSQRQDAGFILKESGLATLLIFPEAFDVIADFYFNETPADISDPAWAHVAEGVITFNSGKMHVDGGSEVEVGILLDPGNYAFRVYFGKFVNPIVAPHQNDWYQKLAICFHKSEAEETNEIKVLKDGPLQ